MVPSRQLARLITLSQECDAKVVLVGDHAQLGAVEAGGLFRLLANDTRTAELTTIRRFANPWEADASLQLRHRDPNAIAAYAEHDRIGAGDRPAVLDDAFDRWQHARAAGASVVVCARDHDTALVVTDPTDVEHHHPDPAPDPTALLINALRRDTGERSAIDELRHTLDRSESLAVLKPRLANLEHWIREHEPVDKGSDLDRARGKLAGFEQHAKPGRLSRRGRDDQRALDALSSKVDRLAEHQQQRVTWLAENVDTFEYRDQLVEQITQRRAALCRQALAEQPDHLVELLGPVPEGAAAYRWALRAGRIEGYREEWGTPPNELRRRPTDTVQRAAWDHDVQGPIDTAEFERRQRDQAKQRQLTRHSGIERGVEIEHDFGIEL